MSESPEVGRDLDGISTKRAAIATLNTQLIANATQLAQAEATRARLVRSGGSVAELRTRATRIEDLRQKQESLAAKLREEEAALAALIERMLATTTPENMVATLDGRLPILLLPTRLETRFFSNNTELRIRVYPDQVHLNAHEPELTDSEQRGGKWYWDQRWQGTGTEAALSAWRTLVKGFGPWRASWIARALKPTNTDALGTAAPPQFPQVESKAEAWTRAIQASALPDRWVAIGFQGTTEVFRKWGQAVPDALAVSLTPDPSEAGPPPAENALPVDEGLQWTVDYDRARGQGMAITVTDADLPGGRKLANGLSQLVVFGMDWTLKPEQSAAALARLLNAHQHSDGLGFVKPGTPTNNTGSVRSGLDADDKLVDLLDPSKPGASGANRDASQLLARALGLMAGSVLLDRVPGAAATRQRTASLLFNALWRSTLGHYVDEMCNPDGDTPDTPPILDEATQDQVRDHVEAYLQPGGPLPTLRIGKQPYGVLPVVAPSFKPAPNDAFTGRLHRLLNRLRPFWTRGLSEVPSIGSSNSREALDGALLEILHATPLSSTARFRRVLGSATAANTLGLEQYEEIQADLLDHIVGPHFGLTRPPRISGFVTDPRSYNLPVPWVQAGEISDTEGLEPNYIEGIADALRGKLGSDGRSVLTAQEDADTLLQALLAHAALEEIDRSANKLVRLHHSNIGRPIEAAAQTGAIGVPEMLHVEQEEPRLRTSALQTAQVYSRVELAQVILPTLTNDLTLAAHITKAGQDSGLLRKPEFADLASFLASLDELKAVPSAELERAFRGLLDCYSHRLDAWYTSLAVRRLNELRDARPLGLHLGGYGWVENLKPDVQADSLGYIHTPSIPHAITAAVLRSGHLSHQTGEGPSGQTPFNIDLSSRRVRVALDVIYGVAQGRPLATLLGYRFERSLRERDITLARFILALRRVAPLRPNNEAIPAGESVESIAMRDVVDGVTLLDKWRKEGEALFNQQPIAAQGPSTADKTKIGAVLNDLAEVLDAAGDVLLAESLYQTVQGNYERAGAAVAALDRQERPVEPAVVHTPRTGMGYAQRVMVLLGTGGLPPSWSPVNDQRARAEPRVNAWAGSLLGDPHRIRLAARILRERADGDPPDEIGRLGATIDALGVSPVSLVFAAAPGGRQKPSELEERLVLHFASMVADFDERTIIELLETPPDSAPAGSIGLGELRALLDWIRVLISDRRAADGRDLALPEELPADGINPVELAARAATLKTTLAQTVSDLKGAGTADALRAALSQSAALNAPNALPRNSQNGAEAVAELKAQAEGARVHLAQLQAEIAQADGTIAGKTLSVLEEAAHHASTIKIIFGKSFPVLATFTAANAAELDASLADQSSLNNGDALAPLGWLRKMALVQPGVDGLASVLSGAALLGSPAAGAASCMLVQLPHQPSQRWLALPFSDGTEPTGDLAVFIHAHTKLDFAMPLAGFVCDEWTEVIPNASETTGVSFHYDAPAARPPQVMILAVPPEPDMAKWSFQVVLDTVNETFALGRLRAVGPKEIAVLAGGLLPALYLPNNFTKDVPSLDFFKLREKHLANVMAVGVLGKEFSKSS